MAPTAITALSFVIAAAATTLIFDVRITLIAYRLAQDHPIIGWLLAISVQAMPYTIVVLSAAIVAIAIMRLPGRRNDDREIPSNPGATRKRHGLCRRRG